MVDLFFPEVLILEHNGGVFQHFSHGSAKKSTDRQQTLTQRGALSGNNSHMALRESPLNIGTDFAK
jgi:hypothetical protein